MHLEQTALALAKKTSDVFETSDVWEIVGDNNFSPLQDIIIPKPISFPQTEFILLDIGCLPDSRCLGKPLVQRNASKTNSARLATRHRMFLKHPKCGKIVGAK
ncbi:hypothetical protein D9V87_02820 [Bacteroidetes/Chlorobi group bacterium MS-B_bin-24]|jgi:hypothetical protein|nr:MAG: hypothetical protein D9V87_02820 [Bacteroidetes/Chlorobi group bacterium MS-B_bin-24]